MISNKVQITVFGIWYEIIQKYKKGVKFMKEYRNAIRSKKMIKEAFAKLVNEKQSIEKITVKEIVEEADISKSTFYAHYDDIYDLMEDFENEFINYLENELEDFMSKPNKDFFPYIQKTVNLLKEKEKTYKLIVSAGIPSYFIHKLKNIINKRVSKDTSFTKLSNDLPTRKVQLDFVVSGIIGVIEDYFKGILQISLDEIGVVMNNILLQLVN